MDQVRMRYMPKSYIEEMEKERIVRMTPDEQAHYIGNKMAQETLRNIEKSLKRNNA